MRCDIERDLLCISFHVYQIILSLYDLAIPLNIHDTTGKRIKRKKKKKKDCARKSVVRVLHPAPFRRGCDKINGLLTTRHFITLGHLSSFSSEKKKKRTKGAKSEALPTSFRRTASLMVILTRSTSVF